MFEKARDDEIAATAQEFMANTLGTAYVMTRDMKHTHNFLIKEDECFTHDIVSMYKEIFKALEKWGITERPFRVKVVASHLRRSIEFTTGYIVHSDGIEIEER
jgi:hypothetical protein